MSVNVYRDGKVSPSARASRYAPRATSPVAVSPTDMGTEPEPPRRRVAATCPGPIPDGPEFWAFVDSVAAAVPNYSDEQLDRIARLFRGGRPGSAPGPSPAPEP